MVELKVAKDSDNCAQDSPFIVESLLPTPHSPSFLCQLSSSQARKSKGAAWNPEQSLVSPLVSPCFQWGKVTAWGHPWLSPAQPHAPGTRLGATQGLQCSRPPAAGACCLLLSCPVQQPQGLGYRTVSNFVPVPRHQGRGT